VKTEVVCSWCGCSMGWKDCEFADLADIPHYITHGICPECLEKEMAEIKAMTNNESNQ